MLEIKNIRKIYGDGYEAIKSFNIDIAKGEFITLLGPSGCGKTTMLKMIAGFESPTSGKILFNKIDIKDLPIQRRPTATVFQDYALFPNMNVKENIEYGLKLMRLPIENLEKDITKDVQRKVQEAEKKANGKIKTILKKQEAIKKDLDKLNGKLESNPDLNELRNLEWEDIDIRINKIVEEFEKISDKNFFNSISFKLKFKDKINDVYNFFGSDKEIKFTIRRGKSEESNLIADYFTLKKNYRTVTNINKKIEELTDKYNDLDYWVSYWQNYPSSEQEWYEKKLLTRKMTKEEIDAEVKRILELVGLSGKEKKYPSDLSGGMQQRVALARALVVQPDILLLDEPLSALDAKVRKQMQIEMKRLHKELGLTFILVTHDQEEALILSDRIVVMSHGQIEQIGTPMEIYDKPNNIWIANFIGRANIFDGVMKQNGKVEIFGKQIPVADDYRKIKSGTKVKVMIRPEDFDVVSKQKSYLTAKVKEVIYKGLLWDIKCQLDESLFNIEAINKVGLNKEINVAWDIEDMHIMEETNEQN